MEPVILLTFANDDDKYLPNLKREGKSIDQSFRRHQINNTILFKKEDNTSIDDIFGLIKDFGEGLHIFHYGGHANGSGLRLTGIDGHPEEGHKKGLARLLGEQEKLKLVFLNGCATQGHVDMLFEAGVPLVIATSVNIDDKNATDFAKQFYEYLGSHRSIQQSFNSARAFIETKTSSSGNRVVNWDGKTESAATSKDFPWGLYINHSHRSQGEIEKALNWKPPSAPTPTIVVSDAGDYGSEADPFSELMTMLFHEAVKYNPDLANRVNESKEKNRSLPMRKIRPEIIYCLPMPVCEHLRMLVGHTGAGMEQLKLTVNTYNACAELVCFTFLSQLWDCLQHKIIYNIKEEHLTVLNSFIGLTRENTETFNYLKLAKTILTIFQDHKIEPFIEGFKDVSSRFTEGENFSQAHQFFEAIKSKLAEKPNSIPEIEKLCHQSIKALGDILLVMAPIMKYKITSVKRVEVERERYKPAHFKHKWVVLDVQDAMIIDEYCRIEEKYTDHNSVIILELKKNPNSQVYDDTILIDKHLSLSPLVIDENALKNTKRSKLFFYRSHDNQTNEYHYTLATKHDFPLTVSRENLPDSGPQRTNFEKILELQDRFKTAILSINEG